MSRISLTVTLLFLSYFAFASPASAQQPAAGTQQAPREIPNLPPDSDRYRALELYAIGEFLPYEQYLLKTLQWYIYQYDDLSKKFDELAVRNSIIREWKLTNKDKDKRLTQFDLDQRVAKARHVLEANPRSKMGEYKRQIRQLYLDLSDHFTVVSKPVLAEKFRKEAYKYNN
jgi:hypothetical protein